MLKSLIIVHGTSNWTKIGESFPERTGKQCRERWYNHLDPHVKKGEWTPEVIIHWTLHDYSDVPETVDSHSSHFSKRRTKFYNACTRQSVTNGQR